MKPIKNRLISFFSSVTWTQIPVASKRLFAMVMALHFILSGWFISRNYFTHDEFGYYGWAVRWAQGNPARIEPTDDSKTPIVAPALLPVVVKKWIQPDNDNHAIALLQAGRWFMYVYTLLGSFVFLLLSYRLFGGRKWLLPLALLLFDPLVFSYSMIVGSDLPSMVLLLLSVYTLWRYWQSNELKYWLWMCIAVSLAVVAKASMVYAVPLLLIVSLLAPAMPMYKRLSFFCRLLIMAVTFLLLVHAAYFFQDSFFPVSKLPQKSKAFQQLVSILELIRNWRVPLPYHFVSSFDSLKYNQQLGGGLGDAHSFIGVYFHQTYFAKGPVWYYYLYVFMYKWPLLVWSLLMGSIVLLRSRLQKWRFWQQHIFWWLPLLVYGLILSLMNPFQIGMRHALLLFPFLYLLVGYAANWCWVHFKKTIQVFVLLYSLSWLSYWPNMLSYTNELVWPKHLVYKKLFDSSVSYGHAKSYLDYFLQQHPEYKQPTATPATGKFAIDIEKVAAPLNAYGLQWLLQLKQPNGHYMHVVLLYEVTGADLQKQGSNVSGK